MGPSEDRGDWGLTPPERELQHFSEVVFTGGATEPYVGMPSFRYGITGITGGISRITVDLAAGATVDQLSDLLSPLSVEARARITFRSTTVSASEVLADYVRISSRTWLCGERTSYSVDYDPGRDKFVIEFDQNVTTASLDKVMAIDPARIEAKRGDGFERAFRPGADPHRFGGAEYFVR